MRRLKIIPRKLTTLEGPASIKELAGLLRDGELYFTGLPWTGKTVASLWVSSRAAPRGVVFHLSHKRSALAGRSYNVEEWILDARDSVRIVTLSVDPHVPSPLYILIIASALGAVKAWEKGRVDLLSLLLKRRARPGLAERVRSRLRARDISGLVISTLDIVSSIVTGLGASSILSVARELLDRLRGGERVETPVVLDDLEVLTIEKRTGLIGEVSSALRCKGISLVSATRVDAPFPVSRGVHGALEYIRRERIYSKCSSLKELSRRIVIVEPDHEFTARVVSSLSSLVDPERVSREAHGLPGVAVARIRGGILELMGVRVDDLGELISYMTSRSTETEPITPLLAIGGPLWADTAAIIGRDLSRRLLEASRRPEVIQAVPRSLRGILRLSLLRVANRLAIGSLLGEYAADPNLVAAHATVDGRLMLSLRQEISDFLSSAVPNTVERENDIGGLVLRLLLTEAPKACFESLSKSNPVADLFTARLSHYAAHKELGRSEDYYRIYAVSLTSLLLNTPGLAIQVPPLKPPPNPDMLTMVSGLKLAYQLFESATNNPGLTSLLADLGLEDLITYSLNVPGLPRLLALMALVARARLQSDVEEAKSLAKTVLKEPEAGCSVLLVKARAILGAAATIIEEGETDHGYWLLDKALHYVESLPKDPGLCDHEDLSLLYYPSKSPEDLYTDDRIEIGAYIRYLLGLTLLNRCDQSAIDRILEAVKMLLTMYDRRPYYVVHNAVTTLHMAIKAVALLHPAPCSAEIVLPLPGNSSMEKLRIHGVSHAQRELYKYALRFPNTVGRDVLDVIYAQYAILAKYCGENPEPPHHARGEVLDTLWMKIAKGECTSPPCYREGLEALGCV